MGLGIEMILEQDSSSRGDGSVQAGSNEGVIVDLL